MGVERQARRESIKNRQPVRQGGNGASFTADRERVMIAVMKLSQTQHEESTFRKWWNSRSFIQRRMIRLCLSILVMLICFPLYYLGFFGGVEGPLNPSEIGDALARMGVTKTQSMIFFPTLLIVSVSWNWIYNLVSLVMGARLTCNKADDRGHPCGASVKRSKAIRKK
ncbi:MAG: hypothetical protein P8175_04615, partial [Deltaproteobacteria bacterium]